MTSESGIDIAALRREYGDRGLEPTDLGTDPIAAVRSWLADATAAGLHEPNAMAVSTVGPDGPASRLVLLKGLDERGFVFFTNYESRKATELDAEPACALLFPWHPLSRQVRVEGRATRTSSAESDAYFATRPPPSQIGAWASPQSTVVPSRQYLEERYAAETTRLAEGGPVPRPPYWGGYRIVPYRIEFWQGRPGRMHDRVRYDRAAPEAAWSVVRLAP